MNLIKRIYARTFQTVLWLTIPFLPYREPEIIDKLLDIPSIVKKQNKRKPLIVCGKNVIKKQFSLDLLESFKKENIECTIFNEVVANPTTDIIYRGEKVYKENNCDCLIALGGGSPIDSAKAIAARITYPNKPINKMAGLMKIIRKTPLIIAIPTTAGTGSETTIAAVIVDSETRHKYAINSFPLIPSYACLDASTIHELPTPIAASTGLDALTHAIEAYVGKSTTHKSRKDAELAVKMIIENIVESSNHISKQAERNMLYASYYAGRSFTKSYVGYVHAISHSLSGMYDLSHSLTNAVLLPQILEEYGEAVYKPLAKLALILGFGNKQENKDVLAKRFIAKIYELNKQLNIPEKINGVRKEDIDLMISNAYKEAYPLYPCPVMWDKEKLKEVYYKTCEIE